MKIFERGFRKAVRYINACLYERERARRQRQVEVHMPTIHTREQKIRLAIRHHGRRASLMDQQRADMLAHLRAENAASECARIAAEGVRR